MGSIITGSGIDVPRHVVTNHDLAVVMDTSDEWITTRSGVEERRFVEPGITTSDLAAAAGLAAVEDAGCGPELIDAAVIATMTPDQLAPGIAGLVQHKMGLPRTAVYDIRQQCSGFLYALDLADALIEGGRADRVVVIGAEVHSGYLPWSDAVWRYLRGESAERPSEADRRRAGDFRDWSVLFGDGAGAVVVENAASSGAGFRTFALHTDGSAFDLIMVPGVGFRHRPYVDSAQLDADLHLPTIQGRKLFRLAVSLMPAAIREAAASAGIGVEDIDLVIATRPTPESSTPSRASSASTTPRCPTTSPGTGTRRRRHCPSCSTRCEVGIGSLPGRGCASPRSAPGPTGARRSTGSPEP